MYHRKINYVFRFALLNIADNAGRKGLLHFCYKNFIRDDDYTRNCKSLLLHPKIKPHICLQIEEIYYENQQ